MERLNLCDLCDHESLRVTKLSRKVLTISIGDILTLINKGVKVSLYASGDEYFILDEEDIESIKGEKYNG